MEKDLINSRLDALAAIPFRAKFRLWGTERKILLQKGLPTILEHADDLVTRRLAPAQPKRDGKQTPYKGHPVFLAQHATATCCRKCLEHWHSIPGGRELTADEIRYIVKVIEVWLYRELH